MFPRFQCMIMIMGLWCVGVWSVESPFYKQPNHTFEELYKLQTTFYDNFLYPANIKQVDMINSTIFSENVQGRIDDTRNFVGRELNTEYIFGLFIPGPANETRIIGTPLSYQIIQFAANQNIASATTRLMFNFSSFGAEYPVTIDTWITWNEQGQITQYDVTFRWFAFLLDTLVASIMPRINATTAAQAATFVAKQLASSVCNAHETYCTSKANKQYKDRNACIDFLLNDIRLGSSYELGMNTLMCRSVHEIMVKFRPDVHCPHIGPSGGGMCVDDIAYVGKVMENYFTNAPFVPYHYS